MGTAELFSGSSQDPTELVLQPEEHFCKGEASLYWDWLSCHSAGLCDALCDAQDQAENSHTWNCKAKLSTLLPGIYLS